MDFKIEERAFNTQKIIYIPVTLPHDDMRDTGRFFMKLGIHTFQNSGKATGLTFIHYINETESTIDMEICFEVDELMPETEEIKAKEINIRSGKYAVAYHQGSRKELPGVYVKMQEWFKEQGLERSGDPLIELYLNNSHQVTEKELLTQLLWPIV